MSIPLPTRLEDAPLAVATQALRRRCGAFTVLDGVDVQVPEGSVYAEPSPGALRPSRPLATDTASTASRPGGVPDPV
jgi:hypothetical protein